jgi:arylsulfatase A-like enzyme
MLELGWETAAIAGGGYVNERRGLAQGFEFFDSHTFGAVNRIGRAIDWIQKDRDPTRPFFMFLHTYEVHYPYLPNEETINRFDSEYQGPLRKAVADAREFAEDYIKQFPEKSPIGPVQKKFFKPLFEREDFSDRDKEFVFALYDAEIAIVDREFKRLLQYLESAELDKNTIILVTADHGEELWDHGYFGHHRVWDEVMHIPFLAKIPGGPSGVRRTDSMDLVDVMPSLLGLLDSPIPQAAVGKRVNWIQAPTHIEERVHIHQANWPHARDAVRNGASKVHFFPGEELPPEVFDLSQDPGENSDLSITQSGKSQIAQAELTFQTFLQSSTQIRKTWNLFPVFHGLGSFTPEMRSELEGLGYLDQ